mmetsp:Transcript_112274/g.194639  ORF Transcript_112274/g.194639 Transcript_112274/m.194639 type:complete len:201 (-) Transcript_112274:494-1096(-)
MSSACEDPHLNQSEPSVFSPKLGITPCRDSPLAQHFVLADCRATCPCIDDAAELAPGKVLPLLHWHIDDPDIWPVGGAKPAMNQHDVLFLHAVCNVLSSEMLECLPGIAEDLHTASVVVQAVADAALAWLGAAWHVKLLVSNVNKICRHCLPESILFCYDPHARWLRYGDKVVRLCQLFNIPPLTHSWRPVSQLQFWCER